MAAIVRAFMVLVLFVASALTATALLSADITAGEGFLDALTSEGSHHDAEVDEGEDKKRG